MRIIGFSKHWAKLDNQEFTTFRFPRKDRDWYVGEVVQVVLHPRSPKREPLGIARIVSKEPRVLKPLVSCGCPGTSLVTDAEAIADGFANREDMVEWMYKTHGPLTWTSRPNKLTLVWEHPEAAMTSWPPEGVINRRLSQSVMRLEV